MHPTSLNNHSKSPHPPYRAPSPHAWGEAKNEGSYLEVTVRGHRCCIVGEKDEPFTSMKKQWVDSDQLVMVSPLAILQ